MLVSDVDSALMIQLLQPWVSSVVCVTSLFECLLCLWTVTTVCKMGYIQVNHYAYFNHCLGHL